VKFSQGRLSIRAVAVPLRELAQEVKNKSGILIVIRDASAAEQLITVDLVKMMPALALQEILRGFSFAFLYNNDRISEAVILSTMATVPQAAQLETSSTAPQHLSPSELDIDFELLLRRNRDDGMRAISQALKGKSRKDKLHAVEALGSVNYPEALKLLSEALADSDRAVKRSALEALADKESPAVIPLIAAGLNDLDPTIRVEVLEALGEKREFQLVRSALSDPHNDVRAKAQEVLESESKSNFSSPPSPARPALPRR
jgi:HEAT repeat protein